MKIQVFKSINGISSLGDSPENGLFADAKGCVPQPLDFKALADLCYTNTWHDRCLSVKSKVIAGLGFDILCEELPEEVRTLIAKPNPEYSFLEFSVRLQYDLELYGNAYIEVVRLGGAVVGFYHLPARDVFVRKDRQGFWQKGGAGVGFCNFKALPFVAQGRDAAATSGRELIHLKKYSVQSSYYGMPEWLGSLVALATHQQVGEFNLRFFANSGMPDLALIIEGGSMNEEDMDTLQSYLAENIKGVVNAHKTVIIPVKERDVHVRIEKLSDIKEGSFKLLKDLTRDEIVSAHGVPPRLVSILSAGGLGGSGEGIAQLSTFMNIDVVPGQSRLEYTLNNSFQAMFGVDPQIKFWEMEIMSYPEKINSYSLAVQTGILTVNEVRKELGYPDKEESGGDWLAELRSLRGEWGD